MSSVVTSTGATIPAALSRALASRESALVTTDDVPAGKPDPAGYLLAARMLGVPAENCLVVEDAEVGLEAARAAGAHTAALRGLSGDVRLRGLADLTAMITQAGRPGTRR
jgi:sugar-phosphatase